MTVGENIKRIRKEKGLTQDELGNLINISGVAIMRYEKGQREPRQSTLVKIAKALGVRLQDLADSAFWEEFDKSMDVEFLNDRVQEFEAIDLYLKGLGFTVEHVPSKWHDEEYDDSPIGKVQIPDEFESILIKEGHKVTFTQEEFADLENGAREAIEGKFFKKVIEQQKSQEKK